jgi:hypothetical protein
MGWSNLRRRLLVILLVLPCLGAGPSKAGTDVAVGGGIGRYTIFGICGAPNIDVRDVSVHGRLSHQFEGGARVTVEGSHSEGRIRGVTTVLGADGKPVPRDPSLANGAPVRHSFAAIRVGGAWKYGGFELGALWQASQTGWNYGGWSGQPLPSCEGWLGHPDFGYVWGRVLSGPGVSADFGLERGPPLAAGLGYSDKTFRLETGFGTSGLMVDGDMRVWRGLRIGASTHYSDPNAWITLATIGVHFGGGE